jgi:hypothetical protein
MILICRITGSHELKPGLKHVREHPQPVNTFVSLGLYQAQIMGLVEIGIAELRCPKTVRDHPFVKISHGCLG